MAKRPTLSDITTGHGTTTKLNANFDAIEQAFDNTLSRDGSSPNTMEAALDMNSNQILNLPDATTDREPLTYGQYIAGGASAVVNGFRKETQTATAAQTVFTATSVEWVPGIDNLIVFVNGELQGPGLYTVDSSTQITFTSGLSAADRVDFVIMQIATTQLNTTIDAGLVSYNPANTTNVTNVETKLRESVSVKDFGALGDGVTNDIGAFVAAAASLSDGDSLFIPDGDYVFDFSSYTVSSPVYPVQGIINLAGKTGIKIYGTGAKLRITNLATQTKGGWAIINLDNCSDVQISGLQFDVRGVTGLTVAAPEPNYPIVSAVIASGLTWKNLTIDGCKFTSFNPLGAAPNPSGNNFTYKQIPVYISGDTSADVVRGFTFTNNVMGDGVYDMNTYKVFLLGVGGVNISNNRFLNVCGLYPCIRNLVHASSGHVVKGNYFEGLDPADDDPANSVNATDLPQMVAFANATNKGGGSGAVTNNTFALTGSGGVAVFDFSGCNVGSNYFWDRVNMSSVLTTENDVVSCIRLMDEAAGSGSYPSREISVTSNSNKGTISRKAVQITHSVNGSVSNNNFENCAGYGVKAARARRFVISDNTIVNVSSLSGVQAAILAVGSTLASGETISIFNNRIFGTAGTAIATSSYTVDKIFVNNNYVNGGMTAKTAGVQDQLTTNILTFENDATRVSTATNVLDWYEEGTFTPVIEGSSSAGTGTYTTQIGKFTRIGDVVHFQISIVWTAHTGTGNTIIKTLPYKAESTSNEVIILNVAQSGGPVPAAGSIRYATIASNDDTIGLREQVLADMSVTNSNAITATGAIYLTGTYKV